MTGRAKHQRILLPYLQSGLQEDDVDTRSPRAERRVHKYRVESS